MPKNQVDRTIDRPYSARTGGGSFSVAGGGGLPGGGITDHGLLTGLADDDHTQYLNTTRGDARYTLLSTYNLHIADADAHHDTATAGNGLQISGQQLSVKLPTDSGLTAAGAGLSLGLPSTLSAGSASSVTTYTHSHAITAASDVSAVVAETLLKSTNVGGLTLGTLTVKGSVDIINNGDLTVGANIFFVDESQENVGILCSPDPQFALDINGPARATYWIGPHAIQLKDVLLLAHYDGRQPFATNYAGEPNGHMGQVATVTGDAIYRPGMFGTKAIQIAEATTNLLPNPSAEANTTGFDTDSVGAAITREAVATYVGTWGIQRTAGSSGSQNLYYTGASALTGSTTYTFSAYLRALNGDDISASGIQMYLDSSDGGQTPTAIVAEGDGWYRFILTRTVKASPGNAVVGFTNLPPTVWYTDGWQLELKGYATPYHDAALDPGGTATRGAASLSYPTSGNINARRGTIMQWVKADRFPTGGSGLWAAGNVNAEFDAYINSAGTIAFRINAANTVQASVVASAGVWMHIACTWDVAANQAKVFLNGAQVGSTGTVGGAPTLGAALYAGSLISNNVPLNGVLDDFVVLDRVLPADEILSVVESDAPVFAESSRFNFRATPNGLVWADDEGLWMRAVDGDPVLGIYGGEAATKSWGGWTDMASGDLMIGAYAGNHLRWDDSAGQLIIKGNVTATTGAIGGWTLGATSLTAGSGANTVGLDSGGTNPAFYAGSATPGSAPFRVTAAGALTATSGSIGGLTINSGSLSAASGYLSLVGGAAGTAHIAVGGSSQVGGLATTTVAFWAGDTHANRGTAPFRVDFDGNLYSAADITATGNVTAKWILGGDAAGKLSLRPSPYNASTFYLDLTTTTSQFKVPDVRIGYGLTTETATLWLGKDRTDDGIGQILFHAKTGMTTDFNSRIYRGAGTNGAFQLTHRGTGPMQFYNYDANDIIFYVDDVAHLNIDGTDGVRITTGSFITLEERSANPGTPTQSTQTRVYMKNDKVVFYYYGGNPVQHRYLTFDMAAGGTWSYGTTAP